MSFANIFLGIGNPSFHVKNSLPVFILFNGFFRIVFDVLPRPKLTLPMSVRQLQGSMARLALMCIDDNFLKSRLYASIAFLVTKSAICQLKAVKALFSLNAIGPIPIAVWIGPPPQTLSHWTAFTRR